ncbi:ATPase, T2SS/T4P/T4SS family [Paenibacillus sp. FSL K6-3166]|uniref:ATPase, T2SS/T4P/T4SS family n=1 Tax=Paenibacillus sp. FSL K6-3166 TaxID=2921492 RepID=UPI0030FC9C52
MRLILLTQPLHHIESILMKGHLSNRTAHFLEVALRSQVNMIIIGERVDAKLPLLALLGNQIPLSEKVIVLQDERALEIDRMMTPIWSATSREDKQKLMKAAISMNSNRILLSELRGGEVEDYIDGVMQHLQGSITTFVARDSEHTVDRLVNLMMNPTLPNSPAMENLIPSIVASFAELIIRVAGNESNWQVKELTEVTLGSKLEIIHRPIMVNEGEKENWNTKYPKFDIKRKQKRIKSKWFI